jgi:cephalosporin-C deacetylase-like acetyl esterase
MKKAEFIKVLGELPSKVDLCSREIEVTEHEKYILRKVEFTAEESDIIPAYLLIPKNIDKRKPAIYCHHQHAGNRDLGKSETIGL